jgi:hypothetical protein
VISSRYCGKHKATLIVELGGRIFEDSDESVRRTPDMAIKGFTAAPAAVDPARQPRRGETIL